MILKHVGDTRFTIQDGCELTKTDLTVALSMMDIVDPTKRFELVAKKIGDRLKEVKPEWGLRTVYPYTRR